MVSTSSSTSVKDGPPGYHHGFEIWHGVVATHHGCDCHGIPQVPPVAHLLWRLRNTAGLSLLKPRCGCDCWTTHRSWQGLNMGWSHGMNRVGGVMGPFCCCGLPCFRHSVTHSHVVLHATWHYRSLSPTGPNRKQNCTKIVNFKIASGKFTVCSGNHHLLQGFCSWTIRCSEPSVEVRLPLTVSGGTKWWPTGRYMMCPGHFGIFHVADDTGDESKYSEKKYHPFFEDDAPEVSWNRGTPKSSSISNDGIFPFTKTNHFVDTPMTMETTSDDVHTQKTAPRRRNDGIKGLLVPFFGRWFSFSEAPAIWKTRRRLATDSWCRPPRSTEGKTCLG